VKHRLPLLLVILLFAVGQGEAAIQLYRLHLNPKLTAGQTPIRKVIVLPPEIQFNRLGMKGLEGMSAESDQLAATLYSVLVNELTARGVEVFPNPMLTATTSEAKYRVADLQAKYDNIRVQLRKKPSRIEDGRLSMGDGVAAFEPANGTDAIVLVRGSGTQVTPAKTAAVVIGFGAIPSFQGDIVFVDARTGVVLAWAPLSRLGDVTKQTSDRLERSTREALRRIPLPIPAKNR
jgi:hypothetical protein